MSVELVSIVLNHSKATGRAKLILVGIANHESDHGAWPSIATLARYANASERSIKRDLAELVALGELRIEYNASPYGGQYKTNLYFVTVSGVTDSVSGVTTQVSRGDRLGNSGVTPSGTLNIIKNHKENIGNDKFSDGWKPSDKQRERLQQEYPSANLDTHLQEMILYIVENGLQSKVKSMSAKFTRWMINADKYAKGELSKTVAKEEPKKWG